MCAQTQRQSLQQSGSRYGHEECGVQVLTLKVLLNVIFLYLPPHLDHSVPFGPVSQKAHDVPIHTAPVSTVTISMLRLI